jgi:tetratricopeptide (TPR) repeat protein
VESLEFAERMVAEADALERAGRLEESVRLLERVLGQWPALTDTWYNLGLRRRNLGRPLEALDAYREALERGVSGPEEVHLNRGVIYADDLQRFEDAEREYLAALRIAPGYAPALLNLANLREDDGRRAEAREIYERILAQGPARGPTQHEALARLANTTPFTDPADPLIARLREALSGRNLHPAARASLGFALGRALDAIGDYDAAWDAYAAANRDSRSSAPPGTPHYNRASHERFIDRIIASFDAGFAARGNDAAAATAGAGALVLVCGMFRSGSTLTEQVLAAHPRVTSGGELPWLPELARAGFPESFAAADPARIAALATRYAQQRLATFPQADVLTDKRPDNFLYLGLAHAMFPGARIVHTRRDPLDNCLSVWFLHLDHGMAYAGDLLDIAHYYLQQERLMAHWRGLFGAAIHAFDYDGFVHEPRPALEALLAHCGLGWDERCLRFHEAGGRVRTASVWQVRQPLYQASSGRWKNYARHLGPLREALGAAGDTGGVSR